MSESNYPNSNTGIGPVGVVTTMILVAPFAVLAAGTGAFLGMSVGVVGWGKESLEVSAAVGASIGVLLVLVWAAVFLRPGRCTAEDWRTHAEKVEAHIRDMQCREASGGNNPVFRQLWALRLRVPPPLFLGTWGSFLYPLGVFAPIVLTAGAISWWQAPNTPPWIMWLTASIFIVVVIAGGVHNAKATRAMALKLQLPSWDDFRATSEANESFDRPG